MNVIKQAQGDEATVRMSKRTTVGTPYFSVSRTFLLAGPFWFRILISLLTYVTFPYYALQP